MKKLIAGIIIATSLVFAGCGNDAKVATRDKSPADKINMPDKFDTIATKCIAPGVRVAEASGKGSGIALVQDSNCKGLGK